jgi:HlyD family secretion protein
MNEQARLPDAEILDRLGLPAPRRRRRGLIAFAVVAAIAAIAGTSYYVLNANPTTSYVTTDAVRGPLVVRVSATGTLQPEDQVDVGAEISGRLDRVAVDFNDKVTKGQVLAIINTDQIRAQLAQAKAELGAAQASVLTNEATVKETKDRRDRAEGLFGRGIVSQQDFQTSEADYARAVASVAKAKADVANATAKVQLNETSLDKAAVRSPIDGIVLDRKVQQGQTVASQFQTPVLFTLASDLSRMRLEVDIDEADIGQVREGQTATFSVDAFPQRRFDATLTSVRNAPKTTNGVVTYQGVLEVDNSAGLLRPGLTATVDILVAEADDTLLVPNGALRFTPPGGDASAPTFTPSTNGELAGRVWVMENGTPVARDLRIGRSDGRNTQVLSGELMPGDDVIVDTTTRRTP